MTISDLFGSYRLVQRFECESFSKYCKTFIPVTCTVAVSTGRTRCLSTNNRCPECTGPFLHPRSQCQNLGLVYSILIIKLSLLPPVSFLYHCDICKHQQPSIFSCTLMSTYTQFKFFPSLSFYSNFSLELEKQKCLHHVAGIVHIKEP